jgi:hypothetical protein
MWPKLGIPAFLAPFCCETLNRGKKGRVTVFQISELPLAAGRIGICPLPGRTGTYAGDMAVLLGWQPDIVLSLVSEIELEAGGAEALATDLRSGGVAWWHLPITDFRTPCNGTAALWPAFSAEALAVLARGGRVLAHCYGGCGRSGMALMRLMVESGEPPETALARLRKVRPCAVETVAQAGWAANVPPGVATGILLSVAASPAVPAAKVSAAAR